MRAAMVVLIAVLTLTCTQAADPPKEAQPSRGGRDAEVEALKKEIEALRKRVDALGRKEEPREIAVARPQVKDLVIAHRYAGTILARRHIEVRTVVGGVITEVPVKEGQAVKKGDVLFKMEPILYQARLDAARAEATLAEIGLRNTKQLFEQKRVSRQEVLQYEAKLEKAQARARLAAAELDYTTVRAPFEGLVGRLLLQAGSVVKERDDIVTTLSDPSVVWAYFEVSEARYLEYQRDRLKVGSPVELVLADGSKFPQAGKIAAIEGKFKNDTGTITFRADFPNPGGLLRHGQSGTVLIRRALKNAITIPQRSAFEKNGRRFVYVVGKDDVAHPRAVVIRHEQDDIFVVGDGLGADDRIVVDGVRRVRAGEKVEDESRKPD